MSPHFFCGRKRGEVVLRKRGRCSLSNSLCTIVRRYAHWRSPPRRRKKIGCRTSGPAMPARCRASECGTPGSTCLPAMRMGRGSFCVGFLARALWSPREAEPTTNISIVAASMHGSRCHECRDGCAGTDATGVLYSLSVRVRGLAGFLNSSGCGVTKDCEEMKGRRRWERKEKWIRRVCVAG